MSLRKYLPGLEMYERDGELIHESQGYHSWTYEVGSYLPLFSYPPLLFDISGRLLFQSSLSRHGFWFFDASNFLSDLKVSLKLTTAAGTPYAYLRHNCKHDLDKSRRLIVVQALGAGYETAHVENPFSDVWLPRGSFYLEGEYNLPVVFPDQPRARNRWSIRSELRLDLFTLTPTSPGRASSQQAVSPEVSLFGRMRGVLLGNEVQGAMSTDSPDATTATSIEADYQLMGGIKLNSGRSFYAVFFEYERLSDHWTVHDPNPTYLFSFGVILAGLG